MNVINITYKSTNCYLIPTIDGWLMIDAGWPDTFSDLLRLLNQKDISVNEIDYLLVTHFHPDHAGLTQNLKDLGINLILHETQVPYVNKMNQYFKKNPKEHFKDITAGNTFVLSDAGIRDFMNSISIEGDIITTPGHSDDSISLVLDDCCVFTGDLPSYSLLGAYNDPIIEGSWNKIMEHNIKTVYPGHGEPYEVI